MAASRWQTVPVMICITGAWLRAKRSASLSCGKVAYQRRDSVVGTKKRQRLLQDCGLAGTWTGYETNSQDACLALFGPVSVPQRGLCSRILQELGNPAAKCFKHVWDADSNQCQQLLPCISRSFPSMEFHISLHAFAAISSIHRARRAA